MIGFFYFRTREFSMSLSKSKKAPELLKRLKQLTSSPKNYDLEPKKHVCSLEYQRTCCHGRGFILENKGMFASASICTCVETCASCKGRMILVKDGIAKPCRKPNPKFIAHLINEAKIPSRYTFAELDAFKNNTGNGQRIVQQVQKWEQSFYTNPNKGLVIYGGVGVGKTFILAALARKFLLRGISVRFVDFFQLVTEIRASYTLKQSEKALIEPLMNVDILIIDELGKGRNNEFELTILDQIIMGRYNQNKILLASTNYPLEADKEALQAKAQEELDNPSHKREGEFSAETFTPLESRMDRRIMSRLKETAEFLSLTGEDFRETHLNP